MLYFLLPVFTFLQFSKRLKQKSDSVIYRVVCLFSSSLCQLIRGESVAPTIETLSNRAGRDEESGARPPSRSTRFNMLSNYIATATSRKNIKMRKWRLL